MRTAIWPGLSLCLLVVACSHGAANTAGPEAGAAARPPDLSGFWNLDMKVPRDARLMSQVAPNTAFIDDTGPVELPLGNYGGLKPTPAALEKAKHWDPHEALTIENACRAPSIVYALQGPFPIEIFQSNVFIVMKLEYYDLVRIIFLDGRKPEPDYPHSMTGFSSGHWEGDTLVVDSIGFIPTSYIAPGTNHSEQMRIEERIRRVSGDTMEIRTTIYDPKALLEPWTVTRSYKRHSDWDIKEYICSQNNRDSADPKGRADINLKR